jgi:lipopolysaccharide export system protein LptA
VQTFEGNVQLSKGTLVIRAERIVVHPGRRRLPARRRQRRQQPAEFPPEARRPQDEYIEGEAERIEHDAKSEKTEFFGRARVKSGLDEVRGQFISYDARSEQYVVTSGANGTKAPRRQRRARARRDPAQDPGNRRGNVAPGATLAPALKGAVDITPRQETSK